MYATFEHLYLPPPKTRFQSSSPNRIKSLNWLEMKRKFKQSMTREIMANYFENLTVAVLTI
jgi:hypothetical protein